MIEPRLYRRQVGATLIVGLIMLILMTLIALSAFRLSNTNLKIVGNEQIRNDAEAAAVYAFDAAANSATFASAVITSYSIHYTKLYEAGSTCISVSSARNRSRMRSIAGLPP